MYLTLSKFGCKFKTHRIRIKINNLETEELFFETSMKLCNMRFDKIKIWEGVANHKKVITKDYYWKISAKESLSKSPRIHSSEFGCLRAKMGKNFFIFRNLRWKRNICSFTLAILCFTCLHIILPAQLYFTTD